MGIQKKLPLTQLLKYTLGTSMVTAIVPITLMGCMVTMYYHFLKPLNTTRHIALYNYGWFFSFFPLYYILPYLDKIAPYWIGGHVVGFTLFFFSMFLNNHDWFEEMIHGSS